MSNEMHAYSADNAILSDGRFCLQSLRLLADIRDMDSVDSIAAFSTAMSQTQLQSAVSTKVFKMAQDSQQATADLLTQTLDDVTASMKSFNAEAGVNIDSFA